MNKNTSTQNRAKQANQPEVKYENSATSNENSMDSPQCCKYKSTPRTKDLQKNLQKRLNKAIGQLNGIKKMIDNDRYCSDVLIQLLAVEKAVHSISNVVLKDHLETCVIEQIRLGNDEVVEEVMDLIKKFS